MAPSRDVFLTLRAVAATRLLLLLRSLFRGVHPFRLGAIITDLTDLSLVYNLSQLLRTLFVSPSSPPFLLAVLLFVSAARQSIFCSGCSPLKARDRVRFDFGRTDGSPLSETPLLVCSRSSSRDSAFPGFLLSPVFPPSHKTGRTVFCEITF